MQAAAEPRRGARAETTYRAWQRGEGIPIYRGSYVADLAGLEVSPWPRTGQSGAFVSLAEQQEDDAHVLEIAPGGQTTVQHHLFEAGIFVVDGCGATSFWQADTPRQSVEWQRGSVFSPPLNCYYQHFNLDGERPARLFVVTNAPMVMNLHRNADFVFNDAYIFRDRFSGEDDYFSRPGESLHEQLWKTNFISDIRAFVLKDQPGQVGSRMGFLLANNQMATHCSAFPPGTYKTAHRHGPGAHLIVLDGQGYSLFWFEGEQQRKENWKDGSLLSPHEGEFHQHFNTGPNPARYMAFRLGELDPRRTAYGKDRPTPIAYEDEDTAIYALYVQECAKTSAPVVQPRPRYRRAGTR